MNSYLDLAEHALRRFGGADLSRQVAAILLPLWGGAWGLTANDRIEVLARFDAQQWPASLRCRKGRHPETDPAAVKALIDGAEEAEQVERDRLVSQRFAAGGESA